MKELKVKKIAAADIEAKAVPALLDQNKVQYQAIDVANWEKEYPYRPDVSFRIAYTDDAILLHYKVKEASVRARYGEDNGSVWTDACVEFFIVPGQDEVYYNLECNCIGTVLLGAGSGKTNRKHATSETMNTIKRWASLGNTPFEERLQETEWEVALVIPNTAFFMNRITSLQGKEIRANFYKCGDELQTPHFLSWNPILLASPNFHCPDFFGKLVFE